MAPRAVQPEKPASAADLALRPLSNPPYRRNDAKAHGAVRQRNPSRQPRSRNAAFLPRLRNERDRRARPSGRSRRLETRASPGPVCDARGEHRLEPTVREMCARCRRCARQIPSARRQCNVRSTCPDGPGILAALPVDRWPGQFRVGGWRLGCGVSVHRVPAAKDRFRAPGGYRQGNGRFRPELRRQGVGAGRLAVAAAQPAHQRVVRHCRGHGDQHSAAQPDGNDFGLPRAACEPGHHDRRIDGDHSRSRFSDRGNHLWPGGCPRRLPHRPRPRCDTRTHAHRGDRQGRSPGDHRRRDPVPGEQGESAHPDRRARPREETRGHFRPARRVGQVRHARGDRVEARRGDGDHPEQPVQAHTIAGQLRDEHGRAGRRPAAHPQSQAVPRILPHPPARSGRAPHALRVAARARTRTHSRRPGRRLVERRRDHRADQGVADAA